MPTALPARLQIPLLLLAIGGAYLWLRLPALTPHALQAVAFCAFLYVLLNFAERRSGKVWHLLPQADSTLLSLITFTLLLLIGATGNIDSPLYPLTYIHLFFLVMTTSLAPALVATFGAMWFHLALTPEINPATLAHVLILPIVMAFFLFAKQQHELAVKEKRSLSAATEQLSDLEPAEKDPRRQLPINQPQSKPVAEISSDSQDKTKQMETAIKQAQVLIEQQSNLLEHLANILIDWRKQYFSAEPSAKKTIDKWLRQVQQITNPIPTFPMSKKTEQRGLDALEEYKAGKTTPLTSVEDIINSVWKQA